MSEKLVVGFSKCSSGCAIFSWLIRLVEQTPFSHTYVKFWDEGIERWVVYQASHAALNYRGLPRFLEEEDVIEEYELDVTSEQKKQVLQYCVDTVGTPYGVLEIFGLAYARLMGRFGLRVSNPFADGTKTMICSKLVGLILILIGDLPEIDRDELEIQGPKWIRDRVVELVERQRS